MSGSHRDLTVHIAAQIIAYGGRVRWSNLRYLARLHGGANRDAGAAVRELARDRLVLVSDDEYVEAADVAGLATFVAEELNGAKDDG